MALGLPEVLSADDRHAAWVHFIGRIQAEQVNEVWRHQMFRLVRAVFSSNKQLRGDAGFWFNWMAQNYADASLTAVRLLTAQATVASSEPVPQYDAVASFLLPWVIDRDAVERAVAKMRQDDGRRSSVVGRRGNSF